MIVVWVAVGSALGGAGRYRLFEYAARNFADEFPWGTLIVNVSGSLLIGLFATLTGPEGRFEMGGAGRQFLLIGIFGGFTTFSAFSLETLTLVQNGDLVARGRQHRWLGGPVPDWGLGRVHAGGDD